MKRNRALTWVTAALLLAACFCMMTACGSDKDEVYGDLKMEDYVDPGEYKGLEVDAYEIEVSNQEVQQKVEEALKEKQENTELTKKDKLKKGDTANIDYLGKVDGKEFDGGASQGYDLELGSGTFIEGFEDGLIGKHVGDKVKVNVTFPKDYQGEKVAGKDAEFTVTINSATRPSVPEYTDEFVKENTKYESKKAYEAALKKEIYKSKEETAINEQKTSLWSDVLDSTEMKKYPEEQLKAYEAVFDAQIDEMAKQYNMTRQDMLKQAYGTDDEKQVKSIVEDSSKMLVKQEMLTEYIAEKEGITYSDDEKEKEIAEIEKQGYDDETVKSYTGRTMEQYAHIKLLYDKVQQFILDNAKVKEPKK